MSGGFANTSPQGFKGSLSHVGIWSGKGVGFGTPVKLKIMIKNIINGELLGSV